MKHIKNFNLFERNLLSNNKISEPDYRKWWNGLQPEKQQELTSLYFPVNDFGALAVSGSDIKKMYDNECPNGCEVSEGVAHKDTKNLYGKKPWDPDKKTDFRNKIKGHIKSFSKVTTKQVGNDIEILCSDELIGQVMFRDKYVGVKEKGKKFVDEFEYTELGKIKSAITSIIKKCN